MPKRIALHTFGCKVNQYETEELRGQLRLGGFEVVPFENDADVYVVNSCSVTADADSSCRQMVRKLLRERETARVVVTGCYAERAPDELRVLSPRVEVFGNQEKPVLALALGVPTACVQEAALSGVSALAERTRAYIKVQDGCDAKCTYCIIPSVRPQMTCRDPDLIMREAEGLLARNYKEIVLTGVRLGRYRYGSQWTLASLIAALLELPGDFRIRLSSLEITEIPDEIIELAATHPKLCPFFHIPLQSGDNEVLRRMGRWYDADFYRSRINQIRSRIPQVALSADVIVGFAGETKNNFRNTLKLLEDESFSRVHVFRYSIRPGTPAELLRNHVDPRIKSERVRELVRLDGELRSRFASRFVGRKVRALWEGGGVGYTEHYVRVKAEGPVQENMFDDVVPYGVGQEHALLTRNNDCKSAPAVVQRI